MNPPNWHAPKSRACTCPDCHAARYPDLAYAIAKGGDDLDGPMLLTDEPTGDAMRWTGEGS